MGNVYTKLKKDIGILSSSLRKLEASIRIGENFTSYWNDTRDNMKVVQADIVKMKNAASINLYRRNVLICLENEMSTFLSASLSCKYQGQGFDEKGEIYANAMSNIADRLDKLEEHVDDIGAFVQFFKDINGLLNSCEELRKDQLNYKNGLKGLNSSLAKLSIQYKNETRIKSFNKLYTS